MKITNIVLSVVGFAFVVGCSAEVDSETDESNGTSEALVSGTHYNFAASPLMSPSGPAYFTQIRPIASEMPDILCPGPTYTPTARIVASDGTTFTGSAGSCDGKHSKTSNGQIIVRCATPIEKHDCSSKL